MTIWEVIIIAIVEGLTEFLPISSTGHMIITQALLGMESTDFLKVFTVQIQFGAILSVVVLYWKKFFKSFEFYKTLFIAFIPAAIIGLLLSDIIDQLLESVTTVAISLLVGGVILVFIDKWIKNPDVEGEQPVSNKNALVIGFFQCLAMIPGTSRSAASIIGGMQQGLTRKNAAEFSFFLAVPTMFAASAYKLLKQYEMIKADDWNMLIVGNVVAFVVAMIAIKFFISFLTKYGFAIFGWYRIIVGGLILIFMAMGYNLEVI